MKKPAKPKPKPVPEAKPLAYSVEREARRKQR